MEDGQHESFAGKRHALLAALILALVVLVVYQQTIRFEFVSFDDPGYVQDNPHVNSGLGWANTCWAFTSYHAANWHPLTWLSHQADVSLFSLTPGGHHLTSVILHAANGVLLFLFLWRATGHMIPSVVAALLFAVHPANVESVAWVAERKNVLSTFFFLLALLAYLRYAKRPGLAAYGWVALWFAAGLMSKPMLVTLPCVLLLLDWWPLGRLAAVGGPRAAADEAQPLPMDWAKLLPAAGRLVLEKLPLLALSAASCAVTVQAQTTALASLETLSLGKRAANSLASYAAYLGMLGWPAKLGIYYPFREHVSGLELAMAVALLSSITALALWLCRSRPCLAVGWFWFVGTLVPVIGLVQVGQQAMADRYLYIPFIGLFVAGCWLTPLGAARAVAVPLPLGSRLCLTAWLCLCLGLAATAYRQAAHWHNTETLFAHTMAVTERNARACHLLGSALQKQGRLEEAYRCFQTAWTWEPGYANDCKLGLILADLGRLPEAQEHCRRASTAVPEGFDHYVNMSVLLERLGELPRALSFAEKAVPLRPESADAHYNLANILAKLGRDRDAEPHYRQALELKPDYAEAYVNLGALLETRHAAAEARRCYEAAVALQPENIPVALNLARLLLQGGRALDATGLLEKARRQAPRHPEVLKAYAIALAVQGKVRDAVPYLRRAVALRPGDQELLRLLNQILKDAEAPPTVPVPPLPEPPPQCY